MKTGPKIKQITRYLNDSTQVRWVLLSLIIILFAQILYPSLSSKPLHYNLGDVADHDIKAPEDFFIQDEIATKANRRLAVESVQTVYDYDSKLLTQINNRVNKAFSAIRQWLNVDAGTTARLPEAAHLPEATGQTETPESGLPAVQLTPDATVGESPDISVAADAGPGAEEKSFEARLWERKEEFERQLGIAVSNGAYSVLIREVFPENIAEIVNKITAEIMKNGVVANKDILLREQDKGITLRDVETKTEKSLTNLKRFYGPDQAKTMVRIVGDPILENYSYTLVNLIVELSQNLIQPNISLNRNETEERKKKAGENIKPILYKIKAGEMILREGERVGEIQLLKLNAMQEQTREDQAVATLAGVVMVLFCLVLVIYTLHLRSNRVFNLEHNKNLLFLATVLTVLFVLVKFTAIMADVWVSSSAFSIAPESLLYGIPLSAGIMVVCLFQGVNIAVAFAIVAAACAAIILHNRFEIFVYFLLSGIMAAYWVQNCRERKNIIQAGVKVGMINVVLAAAIDLYTAEFGGLKLPWDCFFAFLGGIGAGIITLGVAPIIEVAFQYTTDITLLELANQDRPILRRLMIEAPGTYHHSVIVGSLVEAAAAEIGANPLLAKVCGYYHDIGKINKPLYFIENQANGKNKHDKLAPSMSSLILIAHVRDGIEIAKTNKLGKAITDTIEQHHGTSLISFFYEKAKQLKGQDQVKIDDFRYPGPRPQTKEAGLVMLADVVEAASRTLENPTPSRIQGLVQNLINKVFSDGQLDNCELTLKDLHNIAKSFNKILNGIHHHRIEYADSPAKGNGKVKNGGSDRQPSESSRDITRNREEDGKGRLKRLGLS